MSRMQVGKPANLQKKLKQLASTKFKLTTKLSAEEAVTHALQRELIHLREEQKEEESLTVLQAIRPAFVPEHQVFDDKKNMSSVWNRICHFPSLGKKNNERWRREITSR